MVGSSYHVFENRDCKGAARLIKDKGVRPLTVRMSETDMRRRMAGTDWPSSPAQARQLQERLRGQVVAEDKLGIVREVAGVDAHYSGDRVCAAVVVMGLPNLATVESALVHRPLVFPYLPGLLSFREGPAATEALSRLSTTPDLL